MSSNECDKESESDEKLRELNERLNKWKREDSRTMIGGIVLQDWKGPGVKPHSKAPLRRVQVRIKIDNERQARMCYAN